MDCGLISIIVPVFNNEKTLRKCIESLLSQTYKKIEIIIVNDGSTDGSLFIAEEFQNSDNRVRVLTQINSGVSAARNTGIAVAKGEYIGFCDSDDWVEPDMYELLLDNLVKNNAEISVIQLFLESESGKVSAPFGNTGNLFIFSTGEALLELNKGEKFLGHLWNKLFKQSIIEEIRFDERISICEDVLFVNEAVEKSKKIVFQNSCKYHYVLNPVSAMNKAYNEKYFSRRKAYLNIIELLRCNSYNEALPYAAKSLLSGDISIAKKMSDSKLLDEEHYLVLQKDIKLYKNKAFRLFNGRERLEINILELSRKLFLVYMMLMKSIGRIKGKSEN